jgi:hypothetical protein
MQRRAASRRIEISRPLAVNTSQLKMAMDSAHFDPSNKISASQHRLQNRNQENGRNISKHTALHDD